MKRFFLIILGIAAFSGVLVWQLTPSRMITTQTAEDATRTPTPLLRTKTITVKDQAMGYAIIVAEPSSVSLIPNFSEKKTSEELVSENGCAFATNGGFYDTTNQPLGLFTAGGANLSGISESTLINGFFGVTRDGSPFISHEPQSPARFVLQTGPLALSDTKPRVLTIRNDKLARRMIAAISSEGQIAFITLYQPDSVFNGPKLGDVPELVAAISKKESLGIVHAVNLDGGSASAFYGDGVAFRELTPIGSFFCVKSL